MFFRCDGRSFGLSIGSSACRHKFFVSFRRPTDAAARYAYLLLPLLPAFITAAKSACGLDRTGGKENCATLSRSRNFFVCMEIRWTRAQSADASDDVASPFFVDGSKSGLVDIALVAYVVERQVVVVGDQPAGAVIK